MAKTVEVITLAEGKVRFTVPEDTKICFNRPEKLGESHKLIIGSSWEPLGEFLAEEVVGWFVVLDEDEDEE